MTADAPAAPREAAAARPHGPVRLPAAVAAAAAARALAEADDPARAAALPVAAAPKPPPRHIVRRLSGRLRRLPLLGPVTAAAARLSDASGLTARVDAALADGVRPAVRHAAWRLFRVRGLGYVLRTAALAARLPRVVDALMARDAAIEHEARAAADSLSAGLAETQGVLEATTRRTELLEATTRRLDAALEAEIARLDALVAEKAPAEDLARTAADLRRVLSEQRRLIAQAARSGPPAATAPAAGEAAPAPAPASAPAAAEEEGAVEAFYVAFEDRFRGSRAEIKERMREYLPEVAPVVAAVGGPVLDVGCGRGEWLELLGEEGIAARGLDISHAMVEDCKALGLDAEVGDAVETLAALPADSIGVLTAMHVIEHLPVPVLIRFLDEALRILRPGGRLLLETPNPANVQVGAHNFWFDLTHLKPLPSLTTAFMVESRGFLDVRVLPLHPMPWGEKRLDDPFLDRVNQLLHGPQDYCIAATK